MSTLLHQNPPEDYRAMDLFVLKNIAHIDRKAWEELRRREGTGETDDRLEQLKRQLHGADR